MGPEGADERIDFSPGEGSRRVLTDDEILTLARLGLAVEDHYGTPQDIEWAMAGAGAVLVQSRPIAAVGGNQEAGTGTGLVLVQGLAASAGRASGAVRVLASPEEGGHLLAGEILVAPMTSPD